MRKIHITTSLEVDLAMEAKKCGIKWSQALKRGIIALIQDEKTPFRLNEVESTIDRLQKKLSEVSAKNFELTQQLEALYDKRLDK